MKLLKLSASWCNPCKALAITLSTCNLPLEAQEIDIDIYPEIASKYKVRSVPTMLILDNEDNMISSLVGNKNKAEIENWVNTTIDSVNE